MTNKQIEKFLRDILDPTMLDDDFPVHPLKKSPSYSDIVGLVKLLITSKSEEFLQQYLSKRPNFLFRLAPSTEDTTIGFLVKPPINNFNIADFAILSINQGGCQIQLVEIERPSDRLFTKKLTPALKLQTALGQVHDWNEWIQVNKLTFQSTIFRILKQSAKFPKTSLNGSFISVNKSSVESLWQNFGGYESCTFSYLIVIGRWSLLNEREKKRLVYLNQQYKNQNLRIRTYDNFIRKSIEGPKYPW